MKLLNKYKIKLSLITFFLVYSVGALADVAVIVNSANTAAIDEGDIPRIFLGKIKSYSTGDKVTLVNLNSDQSARAEFEDKVLNKSATQIKAYWSKLMFSGKAKPPKELENDKAVIDFIQSNPGAIGYISAESVTDSVKVIKTY
ncbi:phosphate ABC transporter substrate-binding protein [Colwellia sp. D2M02]|uniref:phosphate ABC transporter substrate-binding protein n=1 Tax=Colwellia sp. D2M02 TaxID=2841562 RepID=UPI0020911A47|nr:phosphate ABC transporter substrate-binding protein [Colwellia sp. D2M02]